MSMLTVVKITALAAGLSNWHTLEVDADGVAYLVRAVKATTLAELDEACSHWRPGDTFVVEKYPDNWRVVLRRPLDAAR